MLENASWYQEDGYLSYTRCRLLAGCWGAWYHLYKHTSFLGQEQHITASAILHYEILQASQDQSSLFEFQCVHLPLIFQSSQPPTPSILSWSPTRTLGIQDWHVGEDSLTYSGRPSFPVSRPSIHSSWGVRWVTKMQILGMEEMIFILINVIQNGVQ